MMIPDGAHNTEHEITTFILRKNEKQDYEEEKFEKVAYVMFSKYLSHIFTGEQAVWNPEGVPKTKDKSAKITRILVQ